MTGRQARAISWLYIRELDISIRWDQLNAYQEIFKGDHRRVAGSTLPKIEDVATSSATWVDDVDVRREADRYLKKAHPAWHREHGERFAPKRA
jgi:hypothetical protein